MNILILSKSGGYAGSTFSILYLARGLAERGHGVFACCPPDTILCRELMKTNVTVFPMHLKGKAFNPRTIRRIADIVKKHDIGLINAQTSPDRYISVFARWLYKLDTAVVHTRRQTPLSHGNIVQRMIYVKGTDRIVAVSRGVKRALVTLGIPDDHIEVIHNGTPRDKYDAMNATTTALLRARYGINAGDTVIGCVSRVKKQDQLIHAISGMDPSLKVMLVGVTSQQMLKRFDLAALPDNVICTGELDLETTLHTYPAFDVTVLPSTTEGLSQSLLESMALGVPVVATAAAGNLDLIRDGSNGLLFEDGNIDGLRSSLRRIIDDGTLRARLIENGKKTALEDFSIDATISNYEAFFTGLITARKQRTTARQTGTPTTGQPHRRYGDPIHN